MSASRYRLARAVLSITLTALVLAVQVSFDDGRNWRRIPLTRAGGHWLATIHNPAESGYASLRATAADGAHDTVTQTIIRAYAVVAAPPRR